MNREKIATLEQLVIKLKGILEDYDKSEVDPLFHSYFLGKVIQTKEIIIYCLEEIRREEKT